MKKVLSIITVLAILLMSVSESVFAEDAALGSYENPYQLAAGSMTPLAITIPADSGEAYVFVDDDNGSTATVGYATSAAYQIYYCRQPLSPEEDGTLSFTMVDGADFFCLINPTDAAITVYIKLEAGSGVSNAGTYDNPEELTLAPNFFGVPSAFAEKNLEAGNEGHHYSVTAPGNGVISVSISAFDEEYNPVGWSYFVHNITSSRYGNTHWSDDAEPCYYETVPVSEGDELLIYASTYSPNSWSNPKGTVSLNVTFSAVGSYDCPEEITAGDHAAEIEAGGESYNYEWTAPAQGLATVTINDAEGWVYSVNGVTAEGDYFFYGDMHWYDDTPVVPTTEVPVNAGDVLMISVGTYSPNGIPAADTIEWTLSFAEGETGGGDIGGGDIGGGDIGGGDIGGDEPIYDVNFIDNGDVLQLGTHSYPVSFDYTYTVYSFTAEETGIYTFSSEDLINLVSNNGMWITVGESSDYISDGIVTDTSFEWNCTGAGQSILVAVFSLGMETEITVDFEPVEIKETPREYYENIETPEAFVFNGNADELDYVDTFDSNCDTAVLGTDGFYHLNAVDGPILFACLSDPLMSLADANNFGQIKDVIYGEDGEPVKIVDYTLALNEYLLCYDETNGLYPLTVDIIEFFTKAGAELNWYGQDGWIGGLEDDAWMFACYYSEDITGESDIPSGDNEGDNTGAGSTEGGAANTGNGNTAPTTGDSVIVIATVALTALAAAAFVLVIRRRRAN